MPDDSVRNSVVLFQLLKPTTLFFPFFSLSPSSCGMFQWKNLIRQEFGARQREREVQRIVKERNE